MNAAPGRPEVTGQKPRAMAPSPWRTTRFTEWVLSAKCFLVFLNFILLTVLGSWYHPQVANRLRKGQLVAQIQRQNMTFYVLSRKVVLET